MDTPEFVSQYLRVVNADGIPFKPNEVQKRTMANIEKIKDHYLAHIRQRMHFGRCYICDDRLAGVRKK